MKRLPLLALIIIVAAVALWIFMFGSNRHLPTSEGGLPAPTTTTDPYILNNQAFAIANSAGGPVKKADLQRMLDLLNRGTRYCEGKKVPKIAEAFVFDVRTGDEFEVYRAKQGNDVDLAQILQSNIRSVQNALAALACSTSAGN
jgi:hypothetical protein